MSDASPLVAARRSLNALWSRVQLQSPTTHCCVCPCILVLYSLNATPEHRGTPSAPSGTQDGEEGGVERHLPIPWYHRGAAPRYHGTTVPGYRQVPLHAALFPVLCAAWRARPRPRCSGVALRLYKTKMQGHTQQCVVGNCNCTRDHNALRERRAATNGDASDTHALRCVAG